MLFVVKSWQSKFNVVTFGVAYGKLGMQAVFYACICVHKCVCVCVEDIAFCVLMQLGMYSYVEMLMYSTRIRRKVR